jgi:threonine/homoserine efflux transporter RhtA
LTAVPGRIAGLGLAAMSAALWAIGGIAAQDLFASLRRITPTEFAVTSTLEPALAALAAAVFLGVTLSAPQYAGGALTMIAVLLLAPADRGAP